MAEIDKIDKSGAGGESACNALLGCPFCGGDAERIPCGVAMAVGCPRCDFFFFEDEAQRLGLSVEQLWNRRAT